MAVAMKIVDMKARETLRRAGRALMKLSSEA
jgi:hypothetical protein